MLHEKTPRNQQDTMMFVDISCLLKDLFKVIYQKLPRETGRIMLSQIIIVIIVSMDDNISFYIT